jgi:hypothetical protein
MRELTVTIAMTMPLLFAAGGCQGPHAYKDVSGDPTYNPGGIVGRCFLLREDGYLVKEKGRRPGKVYDTIAAPDERFYPPISQYLSGKWDHGRYPSGSRIEVVVPAGTMICIRRIVRDESVNEPRPQPVAAIIDGRQFMDEVLVSQTLVQGPDQWRHWTSVESFLTPCHGMEPETKPTTAASGPSGR